MAESQLCILYHHHLSICSDMVRYTLVNLGSPREAALPLSVEMRRTDITKNEHVSKSVPLCYQSRRIVEIIVSRAQFLTDIALIHYRFQY